MGAVEMTDLPKGFELEQEPLPEGFEIERPNPALEFVTRAGQGINVGLEQIGAFPFELGSALMNMKIPAARSDVPEEEKQSVSEFLGFPEGAKPVLSTKQLQEAGAKLGFNYSDISEVPERFRPVARAGEAVGAAVPFALAPFAAAAKLGTTPATGPFRSFIEPARKTPLLTAGVEAAAAVGAGIGAGVAEELAPDSPLTRMGGELIGGIVSPFSIFAKTTKRLAGGLLDTTRSVRQAFSAEGVRTGAARQVQELVGGPTGFGEDIEGVVSKLRETPAVEAPLTAGTKTQSLALQALEQKLIRDSHLFGIEIQRDLKRSIDNINFAFNEVAGTGDPKALRDLALARQEYARTLIDTNLNLAERRIIEARESIVPGASTNVAVNRRAKDLLREAQKDARAVEAEIWGEIPKDALVPANNLRETFNTSVKAGLLPGETIDLPAPILAEINRLAPPSPKPGAKAKVPKIPTSGELLRLRSRILVETRKEAGSQAPDRDRIRRLGLLADSILDDLGSLPGTEEARAFSRDLNDRFTRGYGGKVLSLDPRGAEKIPGELTLERGIGAGAGPGRAVVSGELETAVTPFGRMAENVRLREMRELEGEIIRDMASATSDPITGQINPRALERFRESNKELLARFPDLDKVLSDAAATTRIYGRRIKRLQKVDKALQARSAFARVLNAEDPVRVIKTALNGPNPTAEMDSIFLLARRDPKAVDGARQAYLTAVLNESAVRINLPDGPTTMFSGTKVRELLNTGDGGVLNAAKKSGIINDGQIRRLNRIADEADKIEAAINFPGQLDKVVKDPSMLTDLLARIVGANIGSHSILSRTSGAQLVMAQAGSRFMRNLVEKLPAQNITKVFRAAVRDPDLMADLLVKPVGDTQAKQVADRITQKLRKEGIIYQISENWNPPIGFIGGSQRLQLQEQ